MSQMQLPQPKQVYQERALRAFTDGRNCAQAVLEAFCEECRITKEQASAIALGFGGGMGRMREVCGTVTGGILVLNLYYSSQSESPEMKKQQYARVQQLMKAFAAQNGSYICATLLGLPGAQPPTPAPRTDAYYQKRPCAQLCADAAGIVYDIIVGASPAV